MKPRMNAPQRHREHGVVTAERQTNYYPQNLSRHSEAEADYTDYTLKNEGLIGAF
jgi:hypothetical protein